MTMSYLTFRQRMKSILQTRVLMVRYSVTLHESEARGQWGDR